MRALYLSLCIIAVTALPPRQFKRITEKRIEPTERKLEQLEKKLEPAPEDKVELITPAEKSVETNEKDIAEDKDIPSLRSYYENQSHVVSTTTSYTEDKQVNIGSPQVHIGGPQLNPNSMPMYLAQAPAQVIAQAPVQAPMQVPVQVPPFRGSHKEENDTKNVYTVNVYVNFPAEDEYEYDDEGGWFKTKNGEKIKAGDKCKDGQLRVKGVCVDRH